MALWTLDFQLHVNVEKGKERKEHQGVIFDIRLPISFGEQLYGKHERKGQEMLKDTFRFPCMNIPSPFP